MVEFFNTPLELKMLICGLAFFGFAICFSLYKDEKKDFNEKLKNDHKWRQKQGVNNGR